MDIWILDDSLRISIYYETEDCGFKDNICVSMRESCPVDEKIMIADETNIFLTPAQALKLSEVLRTAAVNSEKDKDWGTSGDVDSKS